MAESIRGIWRRSELQIFLSQNLFNSTAPCIYLVENVMAESIRRLWRRSELLISLSQNLINSTAPNIYLVENVMTESIRRIWRRSELLIYLSLILINLPPNRTKYLPGRKSNGGEYSWNMAEIWTINLSLPNPHKIIRPRELVLQLIPEHFIIIILKLNNLQLNYIITSVKR